jgi:uncharacterized membrane protein
MTETLKNEISHVFSIGRNRSLTADPEFGIRQIVDIAVKALSPSSNDPTTAVTAVDYLGSLMIEFARRDIPHRLRLDESGELRVVALGPNFRSMTDLAFNQIREHTSGDVSVTISLIQAITRIGQVVRSEARRDLLAEHLLKISRNAAANMAEPLDRDRVNHFLRRAAQTLEREHPGIPYAVEMERR